MTNKGKIEQEARRVLHARDVVRIAHRLYGGEQC